MASQEAAHHVLAVMSSAGTHPDDTIHYANATLVDALECKYPDTVGAWGAGFRIMRKYYKVAQELTAKLLAVHEMELDALSRLLDQKAIKSVNLEAFMAKCFK